MRRLTESRSVVHCAACLLVSTKLLDPLKSIFSNLGTGARAHACPPHASERLGACA